MVPKEEGGILGFLLRKFEREREASDGFAGRGVWFVVFVGR